MRVYAYRLVSLLTTKVLFCVSEFLYEQLRFATTRMLANKLPYRSQPDTAYYLRSILLSENDFASLRAVHRRKGMNRAPEGSSVPGRHYESRNSGFMRLTHTQHGRYDFVQLITQPGPILWSTCRVTAYFCRFSTSFAQRVAIVSWSSTRLAQHAHAYNTSLRRFPDM